MKKISVIGMILLMFGAWGVFLFAGVSPEVNYQIQYKLGQDYDAKEYYVEALQCYLKAQESKNTQEVQEALVCDYYKAEEYSQFESLAKDYIKLTGGSTQVFLYLADYYEFHMKDSSAACSVIASGLDAFPEDTELQNFNEYLSQKYQQFNGYYSEIKELVDGYTIAYNENGAFIVSSTGNRMCIDYSEDIYDFTVNTSEDSIWGVDKLIYAGKKDGRVAYYDSKGRLRVSPDQAYDYLGMFQNGYALVSRDGIWGYINEDFEEVHMEYEEASSFYNGLAAVKKNGSYQIVNEEFLPITSESYEDVLMDESKVCSRNRAIFAKRNGLYYLVKDDGSVIGTGYEIAKMFLSDDGYAAVYSDSTWSLINDNAEQVFEASCDELGSSCGEYVPYRDGELWGYMTMEGKILIEPEFQESGAIHEDGTAIIKQKDHWDLIQLETYMKGDGGLF